MYSQICNLTISAHNPAGAQSPYAPEERAYMEIENLLRYAPRAVGLMEIEKYIRYPARAVGLKPSAMRGEARLCGLYRNNYSKTISPRLCKAKPACAGYTGVITQRPYKGEGAPAATERLLPEEGR